MPGSNSIAAASALIASNLLEIAVPDKEIWKVLSVGVTYTASPVIGLRKLIFELVIGGMVESSLESPSVFAGGETARFLAGAGIPRDEQQSLGRTIGVPIPVFVLQESEVIRVRDFNNIDPTGDTIKMRVSHEVYTDTGP